MFNILLIEERLCVIAVGVITLKLELGKRTSVCEMDLCASFPLVFLAQRTFFVLQFVYLFFTEEALAAGALAGLLNNPETDWTLQDVHEVSDSAGPIEVDAIIGLLHPKLVFLLNQDPHITKSEDLNDTFIMSA